MPSEAFARRGVVVFAGTRADSKALRLARRSVAAADARFDVVLLIADAIAGEPPIDDAPQLCAVDLVGLTRTLRDGFTLPRDAFVSSLIPRALARLSEGYDVRIALPAHALVLGDLQKFVDVLAASDVDPDPNFECGWWGRRGSGRPVLRHHPDARELAPLRRAGADTAVVLIDDEALLAQRSLGVSPSGAVGAYAHLSRREPAAPPSAPYRFDTFSDGRPFDAIARRLLTEALAAGETFPDPGDVRALPSFARWLERPAPRGLLSRYLMRYLALRPSLVRTFRGAERDPRPLLAFLRAGAPPDLPSVWYAAGGDPPCVAGAPGVNVVGLLRAELGIGQSGRSFARALAVAGEPTAVIDLAGVARHRHGDMSIRELDQRAPYPVTLLCVNPPEYAALASSPVREAFEPPHYRIGAWWWELADLPPDWLPSLQRVDELWAGSSFVYAALTRAARIPVAHIPPIVEARDVGPADKERFGLRADETTFTFMFDHLSVWERKNPDGVIRAFRAAFPSERDVRLVIKTMNADPHSPSGRLEEAVGGDPRIDVRDGYLDPDDVARLLVATDCYVSLHRAEGFGLTLAEAMAYAKPVIGTAWSGNLDFMTEENSYLVDAAVVRLESDYHPYPRGSHWAEPDLDHAAYQMRAVRADRAEADRRAWRGRAHVRAAFSAQRVAYLVRQRLDTIRRTVGARSA